MTTTTLLMVVAGVLMTVKGLTTLNAIAADQGDTLQTAWFWFLSPYLPIAVLAAVATRSARPAIVVLVGALAVMLPAAKMMATVLAVPPDARPGHGALDAEFGLQLGLMPVLQWFCAFVTSVVVGLVGLKRR